MFAGKKSAQIREILISESAWEEMTCLFAPSLTHDLSIKIADISEEIIQQAILSAMSIYKFSITDDLMSMAVNELIKLTKIENNVDLNKFTTICTDVLSPRVTRHNKEKNKRHSTLLKNPLFNFH